MPLDDPMAPGAPYASPGRLAMPRDVPEPDAICASDAHVLAARIASGELTSRAVVSAFLDRIELLNPRYNAIVSLRPREEILAEADRADARVASGEQLGALHGLPIAVKDLMATAGLRTTFGSPLFSDFVPDADGIAAARIRAAGAIIIGKTNTPEFGLGSHTFNPVHGATGNAFDPSRSAGGSSGGAAVALALRMLPIADGSDMGGSLRNPAGWNNVFGLRPSAGRVPSLSDADIFASTLSTDGPMARSAADLALLLDVLAGPDPRSPLSLPRPDRPFAEFAERPGGNRIGWLGDLSGHLPMEGGVLETAFGALEKLGGAGLEVRPIDSGFDFEKPWRAFVVLRQHALASRFAMLLDDPRAETMKPEMRWEIENGLALGIEDLREATATRNAWFAEVMRLFDEADFLALPTAQLMPFPVEWHWPREIAGRAMDSYHRWMEVVVPGTLSSCPVLAMPAGFHDGLSCGVQIIGRPRGEADLIALARLYENL
ncbi:amidase [Aureimonas mangrovi]|uniref:amidase n=1 Tax=Aureimonas mangrovi TaxID=2758041 RepID=UPI001FE5317A|nr:amidase [Aureimonas mangrovi]